MSSGVTGDSGLPGPGGDPMSGDLESDLEVLLFGGDVDKKKEA